MCARSDMYKGVVSTCTVGICQLLLTVDSSTEGEREREGSVMERDEALTYVIVSKKESTDKENEMVAVLGWCGISLFCFFCCLSHRTR